MMTNWQGKKVLILGAARQGQALARYLAGKKCHVILNDKCTPEELGEVVANLADMGVEWVLGDHPLALLDRVDIVCLSGGIPLSLPIVKEAIKRGLPLTNDSQIFMESVNAPVIGITGSAGKTTTTTLVGKVAEEAVQSPTKAWVGGNIGFPLVEYLEEIKPQDSVILELSSFQLEQMTLSPRIAAVLNITPNHLDRHLSMEAYTAAKSRILQFQSSRDIAVLNREDQGSWSLKHLVKGSLASFGLLRPESAEPATFIENSTIYLQKDGVDIEVIPVSDVQLRGRHNLLNILAAIIISAAADFPLEAIVSVIRQFAGVEHRLEFVREINGTSWVNDSIATAPERTMAALDSFDEPLVLLLGGRDKDLPWDELSAKIHQRVKHVIISGESTAKIAKAIGKPQPGDILQQVFTTHLMSDALAEAARLAEPGDVVLLSPGCTSYDAFRDFEEKGNYFKKWVNELA
jgi:UDP-N-acetylmuramoylalanine--D-glutamate ligase